MPRFFRRGRHRAPTYPFRRLEVMVVTVVTVVTVLGVAGPSLAAPQPHQFQKPNFTLAQLLAKVPTTTPAEAAVHCAEGFTLSLGTDLLLKIAGAVGGSFGTDLEKAARAGDIKSLKFVSTSGDTIEATAKTARGDTIQATFDWSRLMLGLAADQPQIRGNLLTFFKVKDATGVGLALTLTKAFTYCLEAAFIMVGQAGAKAGIFLRWLVDGLNRPSVPAIPAVTTYTNGVLVYVRVSYTGDAVGFGFQGIKGSGWARETHPFSSPSYGKWSPGRIDYPFNHACGTPQTYQSDVEFWVYNTRGQKSAAVPIHLACTPSGGTVTCPNIPGGCPHPGDQFTSEGTGVVRNGVSYGIPEGGYCENPPGTPGVIRNYACYVGTAS